MGNIMLLFYVCCYGNKTVVLLQHKEGILFTNRKD